MPKSETFLSVRSGSLFVVIALGVMLALPDAVIAQQNKNQNKKPRPTPMQRVGLERLQAIVGDRPMPTGRGIVTGHVEGNHHEYSPGTYDDVTVVNRSGKVTSWSKHARRTGLMLYGEKGLAQDVVAVHSFSAPDWLGKGYLRAGVSDPPASDQIQVFNHSWIHPGLPGFENILRRVDYVADQRDVIMVVGVNNGRKTSVPALLGSAYNVIAVGAFGGNSSGGFTQVEGPGRCKPDIVGPMGQTSFSTPVVTGAVCMLLETARGIPEGDKAVKPQVIKAVLMAGANKDNFWKAPRGRPLDEHQGAGLVRVDRSYQILTAGKHSPGRVRSLRGWDFAELNHDQQSVYRFDTLKSWRQATIALVWHRRIDGRTLVDSLTGQERWVDIPRMADLDLQLIRLDDQGVSHTVATSKSSVDNVEHIHVLDLPAGRYRMIVERKDKHDETWDYALAWQIIGARRDPALSETDDD